MKAIVMVITTVNVWRSRIQRPKICPMQLVRQGTRIDEEAAIMDHRWHQDFLSHKGS
jgi:hypothetical protein